ncbi:MAG: phosphate--AMP phosphotransferase [Planctomycetes bacterium]|nr:phosphate--AMP phosphotransferase [Planctomycetota bacterium]
MLELIDAARRTSKEQYQKAFPDLEIRLGQCQRAAQAAGVPVVIVFEGWDAAGKGTMINRLTQGMDPRGFKVHPISAPNETERYYPWMWRFWKALPTAGTFAIFDRSWYGHVLVERVDGMIPEPQWQEAYEDIRQFERQLADDGVVLIKFWLHIDRKEQKRRFKQLQKREATAWKVGKVERQQNSRYDEWAAAVEEMIERTSTDEAPWTIVESNQGRHGRTKVFETVVNAVDRELHRRAAHPPATPKPMAVPKAGKSRSKNVLQRVNLSLSLERDEYDKQLKKLQDRLFTLEHELYVERIPAVIVYQGWDAAGKGGNIKRLTRGLDPRGYEVVPTGPPTKEELAHHFLWRFWGRLPKAGHITIFDRSWYGRLLVERVEGFCTEDQWRRSFREINEFERQLAEYGTVIVKFWVHIDRQEQLRRFKARERTPYKRWKINQEDWRNREKWRQYEVAVVDMLEQTSTSHAPWTILESNCKLYARIKALRTVSDALSKALRKARKAGRRET